MSDFYTTSYRRASDKPRRNVVVWCVDLLMTLFSCVAAVALSLTYVAPYVSDADSWLFPILGLAAPVTFVVTLLLMLYWIVRWRLIRAVVMMLVVFVGLFNVSLFWRPESRIAASDTNKAERSTFKILSYNVRSFYGDDGESSVKDVVKLLSDDTPDVICLQEFNAYLADRDSAFVDFARKFKVARFDVDGKPMSDGKATMLVMSRFEILRSGVLLSPETAVWVDLKFRGDTVRVVSNHLRSTAINASDNDYITQGQYLSDTARDAKIRSIVGRFCDNSALRGHQADSIAKFLASSPRRKVICGDFNDTPMSYVYRTISRDLQDAFSECGAGYSHTYRGFYDLLRIDFMLSSKELEPQSYEVRKVDYSDHYPVSVKYKKII